MINFHPGLAADRGTNWFSVMITGLSNKDTSKSKILVVDDVAVNVQLLTTYLSSVGYSVIAARDGQEALEKVTACNPDLVLLDVMMPKFNGFEVCERLKNDEATRIIPVIMVTALNEIEDKIRATEAGADDFVSKPFNKLELLTRVKSLLRIKELHDQLNAKVKELEQAKERLRQLAITDGLTGLYNHRYLKEHLEQELYRATRHRSEVSVIMIDIDHFKKFNDTYGHPAGDVLLSTVARLLKENIRKIDIAARYGGEEFCLVLGETGKTAAAVVAEKMRRLVELSQFEPLELRANGRVTISLGVATFPDDATAMNDLIAIADKRLYNAKQGGRNQVVMD
ncbi:MAG: Response regulator PleD [bacterium]|nr:Response regulator PleD [bacterium]